MQSIEQVMSDVRPTLERLETDRRSLKRTQQAFYLWLIPIVVVIALTALASVPVAIGGCVLTLAIGITVNYYIVTKPKRAFVNKYKRTVIKELVKVVDPGLNYVPESGISRDEFVASELFTTRPDRFHSEDLVFGHHDKTGIRLSEVVAKKRETSTDSKGRSKTRYVEYFRGLMLIADFHKHFHGRTFVFPDTAESLFGGFGRAMQKLGGRRKTQLVQMDDVAFEKAFAIYASDQVEARYILTPSMMQRMLAMRKRFGSNIRVAFKDSFVWIAVPHKHQYLEPSHHVEATDTTQIQRMLQEVLPFLQIVDELDLNTRIWSKE